MGRTATSRSGGAIEGTEVQAPGPRYVRRAPTVADARASHRLGSLRRARRHPRGDVHRGRLITASRPLVTFAAIRGDHLRRDQPVSRVFRAPSAATPWATARRSRCPRLSRSSRASSTYSSTILGNSLILSVATTLGRRKHIHPRLRFPDGTNRTRSGLGGSGRTIVFTGGDGAMRLPNCCMCERRSRTFSVPSGGCEPTLCS
jgi:hypothetical protein